MKPTLHYPDLVSAGICRWQKLAATRSRERCIAAFCLNIKTLFSTRKSHVNGRSKVNVRATHNLCFEMEKGNKYWVESERWQRPWTSHWIVLKVKPLRLRYQEFMRVKTPGSVERQSHWLFWQMELRTKQLQKHNFLIDGKKWARQKKIISFSRYWAPQNHFQKSDPGFLVTIWEGQDNNVAINTEGERDTHHRWSSFQC